MTSNVVLRDTEVMSSTTAWFRSAISLDDIPKPMIELLTQYTSLPPDAIVSRLNNVVSLYSFIVLIFSESLTPLAAQQCLQSGSLPVRRPLPLPRTANITAPSLSNHSLSSFKYQGRLLPCRRRLWAWARPAEASL